MAGDPVNDPTIPLDHDALTELLNDKVMIRIVVVVNFVSLSILELLEYGFDRKEINRAMAIGIIEFDKTPIRSASISGRDIVQRIPETGDYYFELLSSKVKLTKLGLHMLEITEAYSAIEPPNTQQVLLPETQKDAMNPPGGPTPHF
jgi:hypothetical protein